MPIGVMLCMIRYNVFLQRKCCLLNMATVIQEARGAIRNETGMTLGGFQALL